jgi:23S rRNA (cytidine1920-2'-O)/16S rRNA (cytidine1409-2'-O)-methyltransferase
VRLDAWLAEDAGLEIAVARSFILQGFVSINGQKVHQSGLKVRPEKDYIEFRPPPRLRTRGTEKIRPALEYVMASMESQDTMPADPAGSGGREPWRTGVCLDIGASHGGFSRALLEKGASRIYALDVAYGLFDYELRQKPEIQLLERKNIQGIDWSWFDAPFREASGVFIVCDVSFISLRRVIAVVQNFFSGHKDWQGLFLLKHQFEDSSSTEKGVLREMSAKARVEEAFEDFLAGRSIDIRGRIESGLPGRKGNRELFYWLCSA